MVRHFIRDRVEVNREPLFPALDMARKSAVRESSLIGEIREAFRVDDLTRVQEPEPEDMGQRRDNLARADLSLPTLELKPGNIEVAPRKQGRASSLEEIATLTQWELVPVQVVGDRDRLKGREVGRSTYFGIAERPIGDDQLRVDLVPRRTPESNHLMPPPLPPNGSAFSGQQQR